MTCNLSRKSVYPIQDLNVIWRPNCTGDKPSSNSNKIKPHQCGRNLGLFLLPGESESCSELRTLSSVREDGEYQLLINNKLVSVSFQRFLYA